VLILWAVEDTENMPFTKSMHIFNLVSLTSQFQFIANPASLKMALEGCVCSLWPVHRSSSVGRRAGYLQTSHCSLRYQCRNAGSGQVALQVPLCWRREALLPRKGWKRQKQTIQFLICSCGIQTWERAQNNEKYADHDQDAHSAALARPPLPFAIEKPLWKWL